MVKKLTGWQNPDGVILHFDKDGKQIKGQKPKSTAKHYYFAYHNGALMTNQWYEHIIFNDYRPIQCIRTSLNI